MSPVSGCDIFCSKWTFCPLSCCVGSRKKGKWCEVCDGISETTGLIACPSSAVVSTCLKSSKEGHSMNWWRGNGRQRFPDARGGWRLDHVVWWWSINCWKGNAVSDRNVSEHRASWLASYGLRSPGLQWALQLDHRAMEEGGLVWWITLSFRSCAYLGACASLTRKRDEECNIGRRQCDPLGNVLLGTLGPAIHVDVTLTRTTNLNIVADQVHNFMETVFPDDSGLSAGIHTLSDCKKWFRNGLRNTTTYSRCWLCLQNPQISTQSRQTSLINGHPYLAIYKT